MVTPQTMMDVTLAVKLSLTMRVQQRVNVKRTTNAIQADRTYVRSPEIRHVRKIAILRTCLISGDLTYVRSACIAFVVRFTLTRCCTRIVKLNFTARVTSIIVCGVTIITGLTCLGYTVATYVLFFTGTVYWVTEIRGEAV